MAGVLPPLVARIVAHGVTDGERPGEDDGILRLDLVEPHRVVQSRDPLRRFHLIALWEAVSRWRPDNGKVDHWRESALVVGGLDDEGVALPAAARVAHVLFVHRVQRRPAVRKDDARVVDHLEIEYDDVRRLPDP